MLRVLLQHGILLQNPLASSCLYPQGLVESVHRHVGNPTSTALHSEHPPHFNYFFPSDGDRSCLPLPTVTNTVMPSLVLPLLGIPLRCGLDQRVHADLIPPSFQKGCPSPHTTPKERVPISLHLHQQVAFTQLPSCCQSDGYSAASSSHYNWHFSDH